MEQLRSLKPLENMTELWLFTPEKTAVDYLSCYCGTISQTSQTSPFKRNERTCRSSLNDHPSLKYIQFEDDQMNKSVKDVLPAIKDIDFLIYD